MHDSEARRVVELVRPARGSSQPWFCLLEDDSSWLLKFAGAGPGRDALVAEFIANQLGGLWGLPIPECKPVLLDASLPRAGTDEFWDVLAASEGWNLAIRTIPNASNRIPSTDLPASTLAQICAYDTLLVNWDRTTLSRNLMEDEHGALWWIDHGSCRFLHALHERRPLLPSTHFLYGVQQQIGTFALPTPDRQEIESLVAGIPEPWLAETGRDPTGLADQLYEYLDQK